MLAVKDGDGAPDLPISHCGEPARLRTREAFSDVASDGADEQDVCQSSYYGFDARSRRIEFVDHVLNCKPEPGTVATLPGLHNDERWQG